jgi:curved DNA-binding protein CbpA
MSAPLAGKFQDHYAVLAVDPGADTETIQRAYARLYEKYGPDNIDTRDDEKLENVNAAYETLSNPELRKEFDKIKGVTKDSGRPMFTGVQFFDTLSREVGLRGAVLSILYDRRRKRPFTPALSMRQLENMLESTSEALNFALWYLKQRGFVGSDDKSSLQITALGMDFLEANRPNPEEVMPFIKLTAIVSPEPAEGLDATTPPQESEPETPVAPAPGVAKSGPVLPQTRTTVSKPEGNAVRSMLGRANSLR